MPYRIPLKPVVLPFKMRCKDVQIPMRSPPIIASETSEIFQYISNYKYINIFIMFDQKSQEKKNNSRKAKKSSASIPAFLLKTYTILESGENEDVVSWNEQGSAFIVKNVIEFSETVLSKYFKHNNFASFVRQLNMYDFHKTRSETNQNEFRHKLFRKGYKELLCQIKRKSNECLPNSSSKLTISKNHSQEQNEMFQDINLLQSKQSELEKLVRIVIKQNDKFHKENRYLWNELIKHKQKNEAKNDKVLLWFIQNLTNQNNTRSPQNENRNLMINNTQQYKEPFIESPLLLGLRKKTIPRALLEAIGFKKSHQQKQKCRIDEMDLDDEILEEIEPSKTKLQKTITYKEQQSIMFYLITMPKIER